MKNFHIIIIVIDLQIVNVKYRLMEPKRIQIATLLRAGFKKTDFKAAERQQNNCSSDGTAFEGFDRGRPQVIC